MLPGPSLSRSVWLRIENVCVKVIVAHQPGMGVYLRVLIFHCPASAHRVELNKTLPQLSIVFITGHGNVPMSFEAMKGGAVDFLEKPVDDEALLAAIHRAAERSRALKAARDGLIAVYAWLSDWVFTRSERA